MRSVIGKKRRLRRRDRLLRPRENVTGGSMSVKEAPALAVKQPRAVSREARCQPSNDEIAFRAYEIFLRRGAAHGSDLDDWLQAERELQEQN
jgi:hypothetical protein